MLRVEPIDSIVLSNDSELRVGRLTILHQMILAKDLDGICACEALCHEET